MDISIRNSLVSLGLTQKEAAVYEALLSMKKGSALAVSKRAGTKRPTTYHVLESLKQKGLVNSTMFRGVRDYRALPVESIKKYLRQQKQIMIKELPQMDKLYQQRKKKLQLRVYDDISAVKTLLEKSLREKSRLHVIGDENNFVKYLGEYWFYYLKRSQQYGIRPKFKSCKKDVLLLLWSDKVAFVTFSQTLQVFGFKNKKIHDLYFHIWKSY